MTALALAVKANGGRLGADALFAMKQAEREATVPLSCHPHTATKTKESVGVWSRFTAVRRAQRKQTPRLASDSGSEFDSLGRRNG